MQHWDAFLSCEASLGRPGDVRRLRVYASNAQALAVTAHVTRLSIQAGIGRPFIIGRKWQERIEANADLIQSELDDL